ADQRAGRDRVARAGTAAGIGVGRGLAAVGGEWVERQAGHHRARTGFLHQWQVGREVGRRLRWPCGARGRADAGQQGERQQYPEALFHDLSPDWLRPGQEKAKVDSRFLTSSLISLY